MGRQRRGREGPAAATVTPVIIQAAFGRRCIVTKIVLSALTPASDSTEASIVTFLETTPLFCSSGATFLIVNRLTSPWSLGSKNTVAMDWAAVRSRRREAEKN